MINEMFEQIYVKWMKILSLQVLLRLILYLLGNIFLICFIIIVMEVHCAIYKISYNISVEFTPFIILLYPFSPIPGIVPTDLIFPFTYMSI
jgi:hypothetical protein